jgi:hypothetical protein
VNGSPPVNARLGGTTVRSRRRDIEVEKCGAAFGTEAGRGDRDAGSAARKVSVDLWDYRVPAGNDVMRQQCDAFCRAHQVEVQADFASEHLFKVEGHWSGTSSGTQNKGPCGRISILKEGGWDRYVEDVSTLRRCDAGCQRRRRRHRPVASSAVADRMCAGSAQDCGTGRRMSWRVSSAEKLIVEGSDKRIVACWMTTFGDAGPVPTWPVDKQAVIPG